MYGTLPQVEPFLYGVKPAVLAVILGAVWRLGRVAVKGWRFAVTGLLFFLKFGAVLYGSGYVLVAFLEGGLVRRYGWLTHAELLDAIALGQLTPGPVLSTATFVGYLIEGVPGAVVATLGIFLPSFCSPWCSTP